MLKQISIVVTICVMIATLPACGDIRYYLQSAKGHFDLLHESRDIEQMLAEDEYDEVTRDKLALILQVREFAADTLAMSFNDSYTSYVSLDRDYAVKNLFAAEEFSTRLYAWCYPVIGCANYRGYFDEEMLQQSRDELERQGYDTYVAGAAAYSTLGWDNDPVLSSYLAWPEYRLAGLIIHELAHQQIYISDDTFFNESFAMAVEQAGLEQWYSDNGDTGQLDKYRESRKRNDAVVRLAIQARTELSQLYQQDIADDSKRQQKQELILRFRAAYAALLQDWHGSSDTLSNIEINNARLGMMAAYHKYVPAFLAMLNSHNNDFRAFYAHAGMLGQLPPEDRQQCLLAWSEYPEAGDPAVPALCRV